MKAAHEASQHLASIFQEAGDLRGVETHVGKRSRRDFDSFFLGVSLVDPFSDCELFEFDPASTASFVEDTSEIALFSEVGLSTEVDIAPGIVAAVGKDEG